MKMCKWCQTEKPVIDFYNNKLTKDGYACYCKNCTKEIAKESKRKYPDRPKERLDNEPWLRPYYNARRRCRDKKLKFWYLYGGKGIKCLITKEEIKELWFRDKAGEMSEPSIDRLNLDKDYTFDNCQFIEMPIHSSKTFSKPVLQFDLNNNFLKKWNSITEALVSVNKSGSTSNISAACCGKQKTAFGFIWRHENE